MAALPCHRLSSPQDLEQKPSKSTLHRLIPHGLLSLLSSLTQNHLPRVSTAHRELNPVTSIMNQENAHRHLQASVTEIRAPLQVTQFMLSWQKPTSINIMPLQFRSCSVPHLNHRAKLLATQDSKSFCKVIMITATF